MSQSDSSPDDVLADTARQVADIAQQAASAGRSDPMSSLQLPVFDAAAVSKQTRTIELLSDEIGRAHV